MNSNAGISTKSLMVKRFRGYLPVVVDVETGGFNCKTDALLEIAAVILDIDANGLIYPLATHSCHVIPFAGSQLNPAALEVNHIDPYHPFRFAVDEKQALKEIFHAINQALKHTGCQRAVLVGHNANFDLSFIQAAIKRCHFKYNPFHAFTTFDTATLSALAFGETVLAKALAAANIAFDQNEAHSAIYDAERTAELFCCIVNRWDKFKLQA